MSGLMLRQPWQIALMTLACCVLSVPSVSSVFCDEIPPLPVDGKIKWLYGYGEGQRLARETGRPMFVVFRCER